jgi:Uma2 family endonuclease
MELDGTPDMVVEIVSPSSIRKDTQLLRELYRQGGIPEYWLVDARAEPLRIEILRHGSADYESALTPDGWSLSRVFGREFRLIRETDPLGQPQFALNARTISVAE